MPSKHHSRQYPKTPSSHDSALNGANAQHRAVQGTSSADVSMGSDGGWCKKALGRRSTARGEPDAEARAPSKLKRPSGLVISRISAQKPRREITLEVGQRDIRIRRSYRLTSKPRLGGGIRSSVTKFTNASKRRLMFTARNFPGLEIMLTLTYPGEFPLDGQLVKKHWKRFRQWMTRNGAATGLWVLEFQRRGAPHFHIFTREALDKESVAKAWYQIVGSGDPRHLEAGTRIETFRHPPALGSYVMKYAAKMEQKDVPTEFANVGRFWGVWGKPRISKTIRVPQAVGKHLVRFIRRAHIKARRTWNSHNYFRDNGRSGFVAWETSKVVKRMLDEFMEDGILYPT